MATDSILHIRQWVREVFEVFGDTPLGERLEDISRQAERLSRSFDRDGLKTNAAFLFCSLIQLCNEQGIDPSELTGIAQERILARRDQYKGLGRKRRVAIYPGAFDPPTIGHLAVAKLVLDAGRFDDVWMTPCYSHMYGKQMASPEHRLEMCRLVGTEDRRIRAFDYEIRNKLSGETYHFVKRLLSEKEYEAYEFSLVIGQDNANTFDKWINFEHLQQMVPFVVVPRSGIEEAPSSAWYRQPPHARIVPEEDLPLVSSTSVRQFIGKADWKRAADLLAAPVLDYVKRNSLY